MAFGLFLLLSIYLLWVLFSEGLLWKIILGIFGFGGIKLWLLTYIPATSTTVISIGTIDCSLSTVIPTIIIVMAMMNIKE
jgi:hypothetical protein